jgi:hypothetical protein
LDFTVKTYKQLLAALIAQGYTFQPFGEFLENPQPRCIILRHDVDLRPQYSLRFAHIQHEAGVKGSYYFRIVPQSYDEEIIKEIASLGHEIGYHYETMDEASSKFKVQSSKLSKQRANGIGHGTMSAESELIDAAMELFLEHLEKLRKIATIKTVCMHGSPLSKYDNRDLWKKYNYKDYGILGEPYFDIDFTKVLYLTDTGRRWDGEKFSVRDKVGQLAVGNWQSAVGGQRSAVGGRRSAVSGRRSEPGTRNLEPGTRNPGTINPQPETRNPELIFHSTQDIIKAASLLPDQIMFTFHPQRWTDEPLPWLKELVMQNVKNVVKRWVVRR